MAGYSSTPLPKKLGLKTSIRGWVVHPPLGYEGFLPGFEDLWQETIEGDLEWIQAFFSQRADLDREFPALKARLVASGQLWISWPKKSGGIRSDLTENIVRDIGLAGGLVDVKVAAVTEDWSGLKFVYRTRDR